MQQHGMGVYKEVGEELMGNASKCKMCSLPVGLCEHCRYNSEKQCQTNALPSGCLLDHGRYRIERVLGEGGYGITYEALDLWKKRKVAVKEFFPSFALRRSQNKKDTVCVNPNAEESLAHIRMRFNQEAALLIKLKDIKEIVTVHHSFEENKTAYYTMELLPGMDMQKHLKMHGRMFWHEMSPIVIQILRALYATHQMGYIHRDVTPDNIFLLNDGTVQLIDFGNARRYVEKQQLTEIVKDKFAPREQYSSDGNQGPWTDIYSLCVTIYYAMTGILPKKATELSPAVEVLPPLYTQVDIPKTVSLAIQKGMSVDEGSRYRSIADFAYALYPGQSILGTLPQQFATQRTVPHTMNKAPMLVCTQGVMKGFRTNLPVGQVQTIGRDPSKAIQYPDGSLGVSRNQCSVLLHMNGTVYIRDDGSTYGTGVNGKKIIPGKWMPLKRGDVIVFGREMLILY